MKNTDLADKISYFQHIWTLKHISSLASFSSKYRSKQKQICYWIFAMTAHDWTIYRAMDLHMQIPGHTKCQCRICTYRYEVPKVIQYIYVWWNTIEVESWSVVYFYTFRVVFSHRIVTPCSMLLTLCLSCSDYTSCFPITERHTKILSFLFLDPDARNCSLQCWCRQRKGASGST